MHATPSSDDAVVIVRVFTVGLPGERSQTPRTGSGGTGPDLVVDVRVGNGREARIARKLGLPEEGPQTLRTGRTQRHDTPAR